MEKLENMAEESRVKFELKLNLEKKKRKKLKGLIEMEEYERTQRFAAEKAKRVNA